jgi:hypothetical protein
MCFQPGTFGATALSVGVQMYTYCYQPASGDWSCLCETNDGNRSAYFPAAGATALAVCQNAAADCATQAVYAEDGSGYPSFTFGGLSVTDAGAGG